jgi:hypothetical protein
MFPQRKPLQDVHEIPELPPMPSLNGTLAFPELAEAD